MSPLNQFLLTKKGENVDQIKKENQIVSGCYGPILKKERNLNHCLEKDGKVLQGKPLVQAKEGMEKPAFDILQTSDG
ncbi:hypothetical protein ACEQPO_18040 [Bacillus sp. SL00103]